MCESFSKLADKVADERAEQDVIKYVKLIMKNMKCTLEKAFNTLEIKDKERGEWCMRGRGPHGIIQLIPGGSTFPGKKLRICT